VWATIANVWGICVYKGTGLLPSYFPFAEPTDSLENNFINYPINEPNEPLRLWFLMTMGYHLSKLLQQAFDIVFSTGERRNDFTEMILHHILTMVLFTGSYLMNWWGCWGIIVLCTDWSNMNMYFSKVFGDLRFKWLRWIIGWQMLPSWFYFRSYQYNRVLYDGWYVASVGHVKGATEMYLLDILCYFFSMLAVMNTYWMLLIFKVSWREIFKGGAVDIHSNFKSQEQGDKKK